MNTQEKNKLMAEFMGYKLITPKRRNVPKNWVYSYWERPKVIKDGLPRVMDESLHFHSDLNLLLAVIEKIEDVQGSRVGIIGNTVYFEKGNTIIKGSTKKQAIYNFAIHYIEWYIKG